MNNCPVEIDEMLRFLGDYCGEELAEFAQNDRDRFAISWRDVWRWNSDLADDWLVSPEQVRPWFDDALNQYDAHGVSLDGARAVLKDLSESATYSPAELRNEHGGRYVAVRGDLSRVTTPDDYAKVLAFECLRCGSETEIPQTVDSLQEPGECPYCERQGPFDTNFNSSEIVDYSKLRVQTPAELSGEHGTASIDGYVTGEMVDEGDDAGLVQRAGDRATIHGVIERVQKETGPDAPPLYERRFRVEHISFDGEEDTIDVAAHRDEFEELAARDDAIDVFKQSIAPELFATEAWQAALELGVAYLFGAPRLDIEDGATYRGDIHALLVTDYGMGKSTFNAGIEKYAPKCINKSATGLSSDVGLLAAAVKDDFGDGQWTIKPGILVRGNGGHVILDEIDKPDVELDRMNDALEGEQKIDIEKAGQSATYQSRIGLLATGNPEGSRYEDGIGVAHQIGMDESLLSRFDGIITMRDSADTETDAKIAERIIDGIAEASEFADGDRNEFDVLDRPVPRDVGRAWIQYARENLNPVATREHLIEIRDWYAEEIRQLNKEYGNSGADADMPVPVTARVVENTYRFAAAFARLRLHERIQSEDVERAKSLVKQLVSQSWDGEKFNATPASKPDSQQDRVEAVTSLLRENDGMEYDTLVDDAPMSQSDVDKTLDSLSRQGLVYNPQGDTWRAT